MKYVIYGCGQVGLKVAELLSQQKHEVTVIDRDTDAFRKLEAIANCQFVVGDAVDQEALRKAQVAEADAFLALTGEDNANLFAAQAAKEVCALKRVIVRVSDPVRAQAFAEMGLTTVCGTDLIAEAVRKKIGAK